MFERSILQRISTALGVEVVAERFTISALTGAIDAQGVRIAGTNWSARIDRITGEFAVTRALAREIVIQRLQIDRPVLHVNASIRPTVPRPRDRWRLRIESARSSPMARSTSRSDITDRHGTSR
jgi:hypothetical protein